jgi:hypothetical protein
MWLAEKLDWKGLIVVWYVSLWSAEPSVQSNAVWYVPLWSPVAAGRLSQCLFYAILPVLCDFIMPVSGTRLCHVSHSPPQVGNFAPTIWLTSKWYTTPNFSFLESTKTYPYWETRQVCIVQNKLLNFMAGNLFPRYFHEGRCVLIMHYLDKNRRVTNTMDIAIMVPVRRQRTWLMMSEFCFHT